MSSNTKPPTPVVVSARKNTVVANTITNTELPVVVPVAVPGVTPVGAPVSTDSTATATATTTMVSVLPPPPARKKLNTANNALRTSLLELFVKAIMKLEPFEINVLINNASLATTTTTTATTTAAVPTFQSPPQTPSSTNTRPNVTPSKSTPTSIVPDTKVADGKVVASDGKIIVSDAKVIMSDTQPKLLISALQPKSWSILLHHPMSIPMDYFRLIEQTKEQWLERSLESRFLNHLLNWTDLSNIQFVIRCKKVINGVNVMINGAHAIANAKHLLVKQAFNALIAAEFQSTTKHAYMLFFGPFSITKDCMGLENTITHEIVHRYSLRSL